MKTCKQRAQSIAAAKNQVLTLAAFYPSSLQKKNLCRFALILFQKWEENQGEAEGEEAKKQSPGNNELSPLQLLEPEFRDI